MQITRQADYALRAMLYLAEVYNLPLAGGKENRATTSQIAELQHIPPSFLAKIISQLSIAGLIITTRGASGGVKLKSSPDDISVLQVVEAIDGPISLNECSANPDGCPFGEKCPIRPIWCNAQQELVVRLRETTFGQLLAEKAQ